MHVANCVPWRFFHSWQQNSAFRIIINAKHSKYYFFSHIQEDRFSRMQADFHAKHNQLTEELKQVSTTRGINLENQQQVCWQLFQPQLCWCLRSARNRRRRVFNSLLRWQEEGGGRPSSWSFHGKIPVMLGNTGQGDVLFKQSRQKNGGLWTSAFSFWPGCYGNETATS